MGMKKVNVEIEIPDGYEFVGFSEDMRNEKVDGDFMLYACPRIAILRPIKKKQIIFTSTGEKKRVPNPGEWYMDDFCQCMLCKNSDFDGVHEIFEISVKWA